MTALSIRLLATILFSILLAPAAAGGGEEDTFHCPTHGFAIDRPGDDWSFAGRPDRATDSFVLAIRLDSAEGLVQVTIRVNPAGAYTDPAALRDDTLRSVEGKAEYSRIKRKTFEATGRKAPGFHIDMKSAGKDYRVRQAYLIEAGYRYTLACHAPRDRFSSFEKAFAAAWKSFAFMPIANESDWDRKVRSLAQRCGSELDWASTWEEAAERARKERKLVLARVRFLGGFNLTDDAFYGPLMDPDVVGIVSERFVPLRFRKGMNAPFEAQDDYGMGPSTFGSAFLAVTPAGEVIGDTFVAETTAVHDFLLECLAAQPSAKGAHRPQNLSGADLAAWRLRRGEYREAARLLETAKTARTLLLKAELRRRLREGPAALEAIGAARAIVNARDGKGGTGSSDGTGAAGGTRLAGAAGGTHLAGDATVTEADLLVEEARVLLRMGETDRAVAILQRIVGEHPSSAHLDEAHYRLGACRLAAGKKKEAEETWKKLVSLRSAGRWAWKAAALLKSTGFGLGYGERLDWPSAELLAILEKYEFEPRTAKHAARAEEEAAAYLLRVQRPDGSWINPTEVILSQQGEPNVFTVAITAICAHALLPRCEEPGVKEAVRRAVDFLLGQREKEKAVGEKVYFMDYTVWSKSFLLWFLVDCVNAGVVPRERLGPLMDELVAELAAKQKAGGGWSYYLSRDLADANNPANLSTSFVTAAVLIALFEAKEGGVNVPEAMIRKATGCLGKMANDDGSFEYFLYHDNENAPRRAPAEGSAGRAPLCALALFRAGKADRAALKKGLDLFVKHRASYAKEHGKALMHAGPAAQGVHYLMFDYAFAARAVSRLPANERGRYRRILLDQILGARGADGGYLDFPMLGPHYGTAMALQAFRLLR